MKRPEEAEWPIWSRQYRDAWTALRDDRFYGAMGGMGRIYYRALSRYGRDHNIPIHDLETFVMAMDDEYVAIQNAKMKTESNADGE